MAIALADQDAEVDPVPSGMFGRTPLTPRVSPTIRRWPRSCSSC